MRFVRIMVVVAVAAMAFAATGAVVAKPGDGGKHSTDTGKTYKCTDEADKTNIVVNPTPDRLWPPNHKYATVTLAVTDEDGDGGELTITTEGAHDEVADGTEQDGTGNTPLADDVKPAMTTTVWSGDSGENTHQVVVERAGKPVAGETNAGRTYTFVVEVMEGGGDSDSCSVNVCVIVPHDQRDKKRTTTETIACP